MDNPIYVLGAAQSPKLVDIWVHKYVTAGTIIVVRHALNASIEFSLVEVDFGKPPLVQRQGT